MAAHDGSADAGACAAETVPPALEAPTPAEAQTPGKVSRAANEAAGGDFRARRRARAAWPVRVFRLGEEPSDDLSDRTTAEERLAMMWPLAVDAWTAAGRALPEYPRRRMPVRVIRDPPPER